jgi:hypothetical protein
MQTMKHLQRTTLLALLGTLLIVQGCTKDHDHDHAAGTADAHPPHVAIYNEILVEFPGHKYSMEIIDEHETTGKVTAFITDAHFEPVAVDAQEVKLNFMVGGAPKTYTLARVLQEAGKSAEFTLTDMELAALCCEGWQGDATASVEIDGVPYNAKLVKLSEHDHEGEDGHSH